MDHESAVAAVFLFVSLAAMVVGVAHYWYKARAIKATAKPPADAEMRLARLEVAIDDMAAAIGQMAESQRFLTATLAQRGLPVEVPRGSE